MIQMETFVWRGSLTHWSRRRSGAPIPSVLASCRGFTPPSKQQSEPTNRSRSSKWPAGGLLTHRIRMRSSGPDPEVRGGTDERGSLNMTQFATMQRRSGVPLVACGKRRSLVVEGSGPVIREATASSVERWLARPSGRYGRHSLPLSHEAWLGRASGHWEDKS